MKLHTSVLTMLLAAVAGGQVPENEILISSRAGGCDGLRHYRLDGTLVTEATVGSGQTWSGAAIAQDGSWVTAYATPRLLAFFDPTTGVETMTFPIPEVTGGPADVAIFADGTFVVADHAARVHLYSPAGAYLGTWTTPGMDNCWGLLVDANDELWVTEHDIFRIWHFARDGTFLGVIDTGTREVGDVDVAPDGTLWTIAEDNGLVRAYTAAGAQVANFPTAAGGNAMGIAVAPDGTVWVTGGNGVPLFNYDASGSLLGQISIACNARFITIPKFNIGVRYCSPAATNSSGMPARLSVEGRSLISFNDVTLHVEDMPAGEFGYFLVGSNQGTFMPPGSQGLLCLSCSGFQGCAGIGRYNQAGHIIQGPTGSISIDLNSLPLSPPVAVLPGQTWNFQCWFRDLGSNNFSDAVAVTFQ
ncbi:MAG: hypothetical protein GY711_14370 [bacterium]|nr:hypothetical protein [bacterium]